MTEDPCRRVESHHESTDEVGNIADRPIVATTCTVVDGAGTDRSTCPDVTGCAGPEPDAVRVPAKIVAKNLGPFWSRVGPVDANGCRLWDGPKSRNGYGSANYDGRLWVAHRLAYHLANGLTERLPRDVQIRHTCDVRLCCEPSHLVPGTAEQNSMDAIERGRTKGGRPIGSDHSNCFPALIALRRAKVSVRLIAERLGMSERNVYYHLRQLRALAELDGQTL